MLVHTCHLLTPTLLTFGMPQNKYWNLRRQGHLNFTAGLVAERKDYVIDGPVTELAVHELLKAGKEGKLRDFYTNWTIDSN